MICVEYLAKKDNASAGRRTFVSSLDIFFKTATSKMPW